MAVNSLTALASGVLNIVISVAPGQGTITKLTEDLREQGQNVVEIDATRIDVLDLFPFGYENSSPLKDADVVIVTGLERSIGRVLDLFVDLMNTRTGMRVEFPKMKKIVAVTRGEDALVWDRLIHTNNTVIAQPVGFATA